MILIKSAKKHIQELYSMEKLISKECFGIEIICDIGEMRDCKVYIDGMNTIDEVIIIDKIKKIISKEG